MSSARHSSERPRFRARPATADAIQFTGTNATEVQAWVCDHDHGPPLLNDGVLYLTTAAGLAPAPPGWWLVRTAAGRWHTCSPEEFAERYEEV